MREQQILRMTRLYPQRRRMTQAGWFWIGYAVAVAVLVVML